MHTLGTCFGLGGLQLEDEENPKPQAGEEEIPEPQARDEENPEPRAGVRDKGLYAIDLDAPLTWVAKLYRSSIIRQIRFEEMSGNRGSPPTSYRINLIILQRMRLQRLQLKLIKHARDLYEDRKGELWETWESDLDEYCECDSS